MLTNITIGRYFTGDSVLHRSNATVKLILSTVYMILLFVLRSIPGMLFGIVIMLVGYIVSKIPITMVFKSIKPMLGIIVFTGVLNMFLIDGGEVLFSFYFIKVTEMGLKMSIIMLLRIICLIAGTSLLTYTTTPIELTDGIETLLAPLKKIKVPVHELAMMMTIALRFIPLLIDETNKIMNAQKARGADFDSGGLIERGKALLPVLVPLFVSSFRRADELALAMECRCYRGGEGRTKLREPKMHKEDIYCIVFIVVCILAVIFSGPYLAGLPGILAP